MDPVLRSFITWTLVMCTGVKQVMAFVFLASFQRKFRMDASAFDLEIEKRWADVSNVDHGCTVFIILSVLFMTI